MPLRALLVATYACASAIYSLVDVTTTPTTVLPPYVTLNTITTTTHFKMIIFTGTTTPVPAPVNASATVATTNHETINFRFCSK